MAGKQLQDNAEKWYDITAYERNCLPSKIKKAQETHWWNRKLEKLRKETRERFRQAKKGNTEELWNLSNATRDAYRKEIREAKGKSWTSFCSNIEKGAEAARLNRLMARNPEAMLSTLRLPDGTYSESDEETLSLLTTAHFPGFKGPTEVGGYSQKDRPLPATQLGICGGWPMRSPPQPGLDGPWSLSTLSSPQVRMASTRFSCRGLGTPS